MTIPFLNLNRLHATLREELLRSVADVIDSGEFILGRSVAEFEQQFAKYCGVDYCVGVNTGTSALHLSLLSLGVGPGDEVITVASTFVATVSAIVYTGASPVLVDVCPDTWTMDPDQLARAITRRTKAIIPVHLHGRLAEMSAITEVAEAHGIPIIEDACQAHGAERDGLRAGQFGKLGCFSFYPGKNLGGIGEGGAIVTNDGSLVDKIKLLRNWGAPVRYQHHFHAFNYRMDGIQGAALGVKLPHLDEWTDGRRRVARAYDRALDRIGVPRPAGDTGRHVYHIYAIQVSNRDELQKFLSVRAIETAIHYPIPVHLQPAYQDLKIQGDSLPVSEKLASQWVSLPMDPLMTDDEVEEVVNAIALFAEV